VTFFAGQQDLSGDLPARGSRTVSLPATVTYSQLLLVLTEARLGSILPYEAELGVSIRLPIIDKLRLPVRKEGKLPLPAPPDVELASVRWDDLSLDHVGGTMRLRLTNRNEFDMELDTLSAALTLSGVAVGQWNATRPVALAAGGGAGEVELSISFSPKRLGRAAVRMFLTRQPTYELSGEIGVTTDYGRMKLPISKSGRLRLGD
jgi:LEA14-like dessication related protein